MKLDHNPFGALRAKSRSLRRKNDRTRIYASSTVACDGGMVSPKLAHGRLSHEDLTAHGASRTSSVDSFGLSHHTHLHHADLATNSAVLLGDDKELHDPNFVRHNWEMMTGEALPDNQLHIGRSASPRLTSRRSTFSSRTNSSRPSSRSGSETGGHHTPAFGLGVSAFSGLSSYSQAGRSSTRSSSTRGLQVEGSILRDEEAMLSDDDSSDDDEFRDDMFPAYRLPTSRRASPSQLAPPSPRTLLHASLSGSSNPPSPVPSHAASMEQQQAAAAFHRRRHWTVAEGSQAYNASSAAHVLNANSNKFKERSFPTRLDHCFFLSLFLHRICLYLYLLCTLMIPSDEKSHPNLSETSFEKVRIASR